MILLLNRIHARKEFYFFVVKYRNQDIMRYPLKYKWFVILSSNFGFTKSGGQSLTNTDTHITRLEKP
jgi:hypothetical protein